MFKQIVVGVDGHEERRDAIALATRLLAPDGGLTLGHLPAHAPWRTDGSIARGLHELCESIEADLLVVGSSRSAPPGRVLIGVGTHAALNGAPCAVAVAPSGYALEPVAMREIGVGYNGSDESERALDLARRIAVATGARLSAFEVVAVPTGSFDTQPVRWNDIIDPLVGEARNRIAVLGGIEAHAAYGDPAEELALYSASLDLLIVGSRGYGPIGRLIHGSTSTKLARMARCPLLVLPRPASAIGGGARAGGHHAVGV